MLNEIPTGGRLPFDLKEVCRIQRETHHSTDQKHVTARLDVRLSDVVAGVKMNHVARAVDAEQNAPIKTCRHPRR